MSVTLIKTKYKSENRLDQLRIYIKLVCLLKKIVISETELILLSHFMEEGFNKVSKEEILSSKIVKSFHSLANFITRMRKKGLIVKNGYKEELCPELNIKFSDSIVTVIKIDNL